VYNTHIDFLLISRSATSGAFERKNIMPSLAEIRAKLQQSQQTSLSSGDNAVYPHWNIQEGQTTTIRYLPDGDASNTFFWIERAMINLPFSGVVGDTASKPVTVQVPCMEMWGETCPVLTEVRPWFKDKSLEEMGRKYWKKRSYLFQGFVVDSKLQEDNPPENPIRRFMISSQIFNIVKNALMDTEIEELPTDYVRGLDFKIVKTSKGGYADYSTSTWARRERALQQQELDAIEKYGLFDLKEYLPKKPGEVELKVIKEMFEASVDGEAYDLNRWGSYFKPRGLSNAANVAADDGDPDGSNNAPIKVKETAKETAKGSVREPVLETVNQSNEASADSGDSASKRAQDILSAIRNRRGNQ
jgi:hypothetical protein